jgi:hypothetical protein
LEQVCEEKSTEKKETFSVILDLAGRVTDKLTFHLHKTKGQYLDSKENICC